MTFDKYTKQVKEILGITVFVQKMLRRGVWHLRNLIRGAIMGGKQVLELKTLI